MTLNFKQTISDSVLYLTQRLRSYPAICLLIRKGTLDLNFVGAIHQKIPIGKIPHCNDIPQFSNVSFYEATIEGISVLIYETPITEIDSTSFLMEVFPLHIIANLGIRCLITIDEVVFLQTQPSEELIIINDHLNLTGVQVLKDLQNLPDYHDRMKMFSLEYSEELTRICELAIKKQHLVSKKSVMVGIASPSTISQSERTYYLNCNADCIGNIQVLEAIIARYYSMHICTILKQKLPSTNPDSTLLNEPRQHLYGVISNMIPDIYQFLATTRK